MTKENEKRVPKLRFKGFTDDWEQRKLNEVSIKVTEKNKDNMFVETFTNSAEFGIINQRDYFDKDISNEKNLNTYYIVRNDDFVYNPRISNFAPVGPINRNKLNKTGVMSPLYYVFSTHDINKAYLENYFNSSKWHKFMKLNGDSGARSDRFAIKDSVFNTMPIPYPNLLEQDEIGKFINYVENVIALHQRKLEKLEKLKQALLQQMFPQKDETVPKLRFANFNDGWEQRELKNLVTRVKSYSLSRSVETNSDTNTKYIHYGDIHTHVADKIEKGTKLPNIVPGVYETLNKGDLVLADASEDYQGIATPAIVMVQTDYSLVAGLHTIALRPTKINSLYLYYLIKSPIFRKYGYKVGTGMKVFGISVNRLLEFRTLMPVTVEQCKIAELLLLMDKTITLHHHKFNQLKLLKKELLQQMFI